MTRRDLEEVITNLEYLVAHNVDADKAKEYEHQLQVFRQELRAVNERPQPLPFAPSSAFRRQY